jgi:hypothetical protein
MLNTTSRAAFCLVGAGVIGCLAPATTEGQTAVSLTGRFVLRTVDGEPLPWIVRDREGRVLIEVQAQAIEFDREGTEHVSNVPPIPRAIGRLGWHNGRSTRRVIPCTYRCRPAWTLAIRSGSRERRIPRRDPTTGGVRWCSRRRAHPSTRMGVPSSSASERWAASYLWSVLDPQRLRRALQRHVN